MTTSYFWSKSSKRASPSLKRSKQLWTYAAVRIGIEVKNARVELVRSITDASIDQDQLRAAHTKAAAAELELTLTVVAVIGKLHPLLTEDQLVEVAEMMEEVRTANDRETASMAAHPSLMFSLSALIGKEENLTMTTLVDGLIHMC